MDVNPALVIFVEKNSGSRMNSDFPKYYKYQYNADPNELSELALNKNLLKKSDYKFNMYHTTNKELQSILREYDLKVSGIKDELVNRLLDNISKEKLKSIFKNNYYQITDKGEKFIEKYEHIIYFHNHKYLSPISLKEYHRLVMKNNNLDKYQVLLKLADKQIHKNRRNKDWGFYRSSIFTKATIYTDMNKKHKALKELIKVIHVDLSGLSNNNSYAPINIILAPGIIGRAESIKNELNYNSETIKELYFAIITALNLPKKRYDPETEFKYFVEALNNDIDSVNDKLRSENKNENLEILKDGENTIINMNNNDDEEDLNFEDLAKDSDPDLLNNTSNKSKKSGGCFKAFVTFAAIIAALGFFSFAFGDSDVNNSTEQTESKVEQNQNERVQEAPKPSDMKLETYIDHLITSEIGKGTNTGYKRNLGYSDNENSLTIQVYADESFTGGTTATTILMNSEKLFKSFFKERNDYNELVLDWYLPLVDAKGN